MVHTQACAEQLYRVGQTDLPLSCPTKAMSLWNAHPRVFLPIEKTGQATCPYCGTLFILDDRNKHETNTDTHTE